MVLLLDHQAVAPGKVFDVQRGLYVPKPKSAVATVEPDSSHPKLMADASSKINLAVGGTGMTDPLNDNESTQGKAPNPLERAFKDANAKVAKETEEGKLAGTVTDYAMNTETCDRTFSRPIGRPPSGMTWDSVRGLYVATGSGSQAE